MLEFLPKCAGSYYVTPSLYILVAVLQIFDVKPGPIGPKLMMGPGPIGPKLMMGPGPINFIPS